MTPGARPQRRWHPGRFTAASVALHGLALAALAWRPQASVPDPAPLASVQVEYVSQSASTKGAAAVAPAPPSPVPASLAPSTQPVPPPSAPTTVNLGNGEADQDALTVTGDIVSVGPDPRYRNLPPHYPREAIMLGQEGSVLVMVHVAPGGEVTAVEVVKSSGSIALDHAAQDAVAKWHFKPALRDGVAAPSVYPLGLDFTNARRTDSK